MRKGKGNTERRMSTLYWETLCKTKGWLESWHASFRCSHPGFLLRYPARLTQNMNSHVQPTRLTCRKRSQGTTNLKLDFFEPTVLGVGTSIPCIDQWFYSNLKRSFQCACDASNPSTSFSSTTSAQRALQ